MQQQTENASNRITGKSMVVSTHQVATAAAEAASGPAGIATMGGAASAIGIGALTANEVGIIGGLIIGACGFGLQMWLGIRRDKREERESQLRMRHSSQFGQNAP